MSLAPSTNPEQKRTADPRALGSQMTCCRPLIPKDNNYQPLADHLLLFYPSAYISYHCPIRIIHQPQEHRKYEGLLVRQPTRTYPPPRAPTPPTSTHPHLYDHRATEKLTSSQGDQREDHNSGRAVDPAYLNKLGVLHYNLSTVDEVNALAEKRSYKNRDEIIVSPTTLPNYEEKVKGFFHEHLHEDEEIRWIREGGGFFDFRSRDDEWVRIALEKDDVSVVCLWFPSGDFCAACVLVNFSLFWGLLDALD